jgi:hypothetical protein
VAVATGADVGALEKRAARGLAVRRADAPAARGVGEAAACETVAALVDAGLADLWPQCPDGPSPCLSPYGAFVAGVAPPAPHERNGCGLVANETDAFGVNGGTLDNLVDRRQVDPARAAEVWELPRPLWR